MVITLYLVMNVSSVFNTGFCINELMNMNVLILKNEGPGSNYHRNEITSLLIPLPPS